MGKPEIRFKGYTDEWEQRKLGDWGNFYYGRSCPKWSVTEDATIPCIRLLKHLPSVVAYVGPSCSTDKVITV